MSVRTALCIRWTRPRVCRLPRRCWRIVDGRFQILRSGNRVRTTQDEELAVTEGSAGLPSQKQVIELLDGEFARAGYEIEDVVIDTAARPPRITVVADGEAPLDLDSIALLSRSASDLLDRIDTPAYVLEVTSPGVDRPLTSETHYRRARGRKVEQTLS